MTDYMMRTYARPYAVAAFEEAAFFEKKRRQENTLLSWENMLVSAAAITKNQQVRKLLAAPHQSSQKIAEFYCDVLGKKLDSHQANFIRVLAAYKRLALLPAIAMLFREQHENLMQIQRVEVKSAIPLDQAYCERLSHVLARKLGKKILFECKVDANLIGGALVTVGDLVMDGSVRGKLDRLKLMIG